MSNPRKKKLHIDQMCLKPENPMSFFRKRGYPPGQFNTALEEYYPRLERAGCETVYSGDNNSDIVFGRDRNSSLASGKGGSGGTQCGMIDIVAGRLSSVIAEGDKCDLMTGPNFAADAARIYITQRGDIDSYFGLPEMKISMSTDNKSAVGIKSDHTRLIGRESVRIYAGKGQFKGYDRYGERNSIGGVIEPTNGTIELIGRYPGDFGENIHPAAKGDRVALAFKHVFKLLKQAFSAIHSQAMIMMNLYPMIATHTHVVAGVGVAIATPDIGLAIKSYGAFVKTILSGYDNMMSAFNTTLEEMNTVGVGGGDNFIAGANDIRSKCVFIT